MSVVTVSEWVFTWAKTLRVIVHRRHKVDSLNSRIRVEAVPTRANCKPSRDAQLSSCTSRQLSIGRYKTSGYWTEWRPGREWSDFWGWLKYHTLQSPSLLMPRPLLHQNHLRPLTLVLPRECSTVEYPLPNSDGSTNFSVQNTASSITDHKIYIRSEREREK